MIDSLVVYASKTGNVRKFIGKLNYNSIEVEDGLIIKEPYVLVTYTTGFGKAPTEVLQFLKLNHKYLMGVSASGNKNWGYSYCRSADIISEMYNVPIISRFELQGTTKDVETFNRRVMEIEAYRIK